MTDDTKLLIDWSIRDIAITRASSIRLGKASADEIDNYLAAELARVFRETDNMDEKTLIGEMLKDIVGAVEVTAINGQETD